MSNIGLFEAEISSDSFQLLGLSFSGGKIWCKGARGGSYRYRGGEEAVGLLKARVRELTP